ncbi:NAD(P)-binding protein [Athelia psychrophila]|uniref:NAD(P)-binding protein n=1 Tax=Athelia psychrophila TaxID=1759441 RepID=A0A166F6X5_9AGAM|nr:NAD(P)-binding protein [Fibularhizoctonia sp. CBS 109695]
MTAQSQLIFVTGVAGYLGSHIVQQLLEGGYRVRGTARGVKIAQVKNAYASYGERFEVVEVNDVAVDDVSAYLIGVDAVMHTAAPLSNRPDTKEIMNGTIEGTINIIRQAEKAGITKVVYTSSIATVVNPSGALNAEGNPIKALDPLGPVMTSDDYNPITIEQALAAGDPFSAYVAGKSLAEKAVWDFAAAHPKLDITTLNAPFYFGPFAPGFAVPEPNMQALSTTRHIYRLLDPAGPFPPCGFVDVRDLTRVHVAALTAPRLAGVRKRLIVASPYDFSWKDGVSYIAEQRPELRSRLVADTSKAPDHANARFDLSRLEDVTGLKLDAFKTWQETILDTVDSLIALEKDWVSKGFAIGK